MEPPYFGLLETLKPRSVKKTKQKKPQAFNGIAFLLLSRKKDRTMLQFWKN